MNRCVTSLKFCFGIVVGPNFIAYRDWAITCSFTPIALTTRLEGNWSIDIAQTGDAGWRILRVRITRVLLSVVGRIVIPIILAGIILILVLWLRRRILRPHSARAKNQKTCQHQQVGPGSIQTFLDNHKHDPLSSGPLV